MKERRKAARVTYCHPITLHQGKREIPGEVRNISLKGLYVILKSADALASGEELKFRIVFPVAAPAIKLSGDVLIVRKTSEGGLGLNILGMSDDDFAVLSRLIEINKNKQGS